jgi:hypothetical protein
VGKEKRKEERRGEEKKREERREKEVHSHVWWHILVVLATWEAKVGGSLVPRNLRLPWATEKNPI